MKYKVKINTCPVGHLRYGHYEGTVEAANVEEVKAMLNEYHPADLDMDYEVDDYSVDDMNLDKYDIENAEITPLEPQLNGEIMRIENGAAVLDPNVSATIANFEKQAKQIKEQEDRLKKAILKAMEENGIVKIDTPELTVSYVAAFDKESFDGKTFKEENPSIYDEYVKMSTVKPSIRIKVKN